MMAQKALQLHLSIFHSRSSNFHPRSSNVYSSLFLQQRMCSRQAPAMTHAQ